MSVSFDAGAGFDYLVYDFRDLGSSITFDASGTAVTSSFGSFSGFEDFTIVGGGGNDTIRTGDANDEIHGGGGTAGELRYHHEAGTGDTLIEMDVDGDGVRDMSIRLTGTHDLAAGDFIL